MRLHGVEFSNFACFNRQFVPVRLGINLLVGRNNVGKTALLRGLSALSALPIHAPPRTIPTDLTGYVRGPINESVPFDIVCGIEDSDRSFLDGFPDASWQRILADGIASWKFVFVADSRSVAFLQCEVAIPDPMGIPGLKTAVMIDTRSGPVFASRLRHPDLSSVGRVAVQLAQFAGEEPIRIFDPSRSINRPLRLLRNVKLISPHRVVVPGQMLQTSRDLPSDAQTLAPFLMTLHGRDRDTFEAIEKFVIKVFPEFKHVNLVPSENNQLFIDLTERSTSRRIRLENCGTGVEQILTLATFILTTPKPALILMDEPHSYLHPTAERALVQFLLEHPEHSYIISTHSAVLMNSVEPDRVTHISPPGRGYSRSRETSETSRILFDLGYRNSDAMFNDRLILVEGRSDAKLFPILLLKDGEFDQAQLDRTGFPVLEGAPKGSIALQTSILRYEKLLDAIGRADQPRTYVFDGDRMNDEKEILRGTNSPITGEHISVGFLPRTEIENYLLVADAIAAALREETSLEDSPMETSADDIQLALDVILRSEDKKMFPRGKKTGVDPIVEIKGSRALEELYGQRGLAYHKEKSGMLIAKHISVKNQPALSEITALVRPVFQQG